MAWNEPNGNDKDKNKSPWGDNGKDSPPDLDEALKKLQNKFGNIFGRSGGPGGAEPLSSGGLAIGLIAGLALLIWFLSGIFIVGPAERAVVLRFGKYVETMGPGPHWIPRFINSKQIVNVEKVSNFSYQAQMLNKDENIISAAVAIQYRIANPKDYLYNVSNPLESIQQATASSLRQVIGHTSLDEVLTIGREKVREQVAELLNEILDRYETGLLVTDVALLPIKAPEEVKAAFDDAIKAQEDERRFKNQAQAYAAKVEPDARGKASRILQEADAYKQQTVLRAKGDVARFAALLPMYQKAPAVTRDRMYIDTISDVLGSTSKVLLDAKEGGNVLFLPLEQLMKQQSASTQMIRVPEVVEKKHTDNASSSHFGNSRVGRDSYRGREIY